MLKDNFHGGESLDDFVFTEAVLKELYGEDKVSVISGEARMADVQGFDLIYILNPGYPYGKCCDRRYATRSEEAWYCRYCDYGGRHV